MQLQVNSWAMFQSIIVFVLSSPDRPFHNFRGSKSGGEANFKQFRSGSLDSKIVKRSVGSMEVKTTRLSLL